MLLIFLYLRSCEIGNDQLGFLQVKENSHGNNVMVLIRYSGSLIVFLWFLGKRQGHKVQLPAETNRDLLLISWTQWDQRNSQQVHWKWRHLSFQADQGSCLTVGSKYLIENGLYETCYSFSQQICRACK